jgi:hypothetical protein
MINIQAEGLTYLYCTKDDDLTTIDYSKLAVVQYPMIIDNWEIIKAQGFEDIRLVLFQYLFRLGVNHLRFLHWDDGTNLDVLDNKVRVNNFSDDDFRSSLITQFGKTKCFKCNWERYTLSFPTADAYIGIANLEARKFQERYKRNSFKHCPNCGAGFTQLVVKIFDT